MREGSASHTARRVAAHRLDYERIATPYGDPAADLALARDVANGERVEPSRMHEYLRARTAFFDRMVVTALEAGMEQIVVGGANPVPRRLAGEGPPPGNPSPLPHDPPPRWLPPRQLNTGSGLASHPRRCAINPICPNLNLALFGYRA